MNNVDEIYKQHQDLLWWFAHKYKVDISICNVGFTKAINTFDGSKGIKFSTWVGVCVKNECLIEKRYYKRHPTLVTEVIEESITPDNRVKDIDLWLSMRKVLTADEFDLLILYYVKGYKQNEISNKLGVSQVMVHRKLQKILNKLREKL